MAHSKMYRNFIILQEDENHHASTGEKALSGYAKIEAKSEKCKISFYAQNLNKNDKYTIVLICYKKDVKQIVDLGTLDVTDIGKGEACKEYYINNIAGLDFSYEKISGAAICKHKDGKMSFVMYGFMNGENVKDDWKKCKVIKQNDNESEKEESEHLKEEKYYKKDYHKEDNHHEEKHDDYEKDDKKDCSDKKYKEKHDDDDHDYHKHDKDDDKHEHDYDDDKHEHDYDDDKHEHDYDDDKHEHDHDDDKHEHDHDDDKHEHDHDDDKHDHDKCDDKYKECKEKCKEDKEACEHKEEHHDDKCNKCGRDDEDVSAKFKNYEDNIDNTREEIDPYDFEMRGAIGDFFNEIVKGFEEIRNKFKEIKYCKWYKVSINSLDDMCNTTNYNKYTVAYYPMLNYFPYIQKYGHFILGYKCDPKGNLKYIVYGVPGKKDKEEQPYAGKTGFVTWMSDENKSVGYWLMFYDFKTSTVVVPMK